MRLFTAIPLPKEIKERVAEITRGRLPIYYINTTNLHITLNFFGELDDREIFKVKAKFLETVHDLKPVDIIFKSLEKFNQQIHLKVVLTEELSVLQSKLQKGFEKLGFNFDSRDYFPHVKLGNMHMDKVMNKTRKIENFPNEELSMLNFKAKSIALFESKLLLHHAKHTILMEHKL